MSVTKVLIWRTTRPDLDIYFSWNSNAQNRDDSIFADKIVPLPEITDEFIDNKLYLKGNFVDDLKHNRFISYSISTAVDGYFADITASNANTSNHNVIRPICVMPKFNRFPTDFSLDSKYRDKYLCSYQY